MWKKQCCAGFGTYDGSEATVDCGEFSDGHDGNLGRLRTGMSH